MSEYRDTFEPGDFVRVAGGHDYVTPYAYRGTIGRVIGTESTSGRVQVRFPRGAVNVDGEFSHARSVGHDGTDGTFHADWLHRVVFVSVRFYGPGMQPGRSEFHGSRYVVSGTRGNRQQLTVSPDLSVYGWNGDENGARAAGEFARHRLAFCDPAVELVRTRNGSRIYAITENGKCECSPDDYGPCEWHGETLVVREGASVRTADDLQYEFCSDVCSVTRSYPSDEFRSELETIGNALADNDSHGCRWLPDEDVPDASAGYTLSDMLGDMVGTAESHLSAHGLSVWWEDGYRIVRVTGGPCA